MLLYNKALDPNHALLRTSTILTALKRDKIEEDRLRIFDFLLANPFHISTMKLGSGLMKQRNEFKIYKNRYNTYDPFILFELMKPIQQAVFCSLVQMNCLIPLENTSHYKVNINKLPPELSTIISSETNSMPKDAISFIREHLTHFDLLGPSGLKFASTLMEYRYDAV
ncbi:ABC-three component system middle component 5 [Desulforhopalus sp. IMCC35007]|uniref:ABC-three component system middle component 5 n=1 Tax=Desulforhopalus sp. IMCC35007 TaxID=2569543 RepID=UPI0010AEC3D0|nr:ABC-three component system middle component 5 [Desulforhopalus sp. IMCC35007]TKB07879.1 hypothetical protein FCL48_16145 [Desulforhopalus sp. IMCC35007]